MRRKELKYVPASNETMAKRDSSPVIIESSDNKRMMSEIFSIRLLVSFLPMQLIYGGKKVKESQGLLFVKYLAYGLILSIFQIQKGL